MTESSRQFIDFFNLEEEEGLKVPSLVSSPITNTIIRTPEIDPIQQEIYYYIESLEKKAIEKATTSSSNQEKEIHSDSPQEPPIINTLKQEIYELETVNRNMKH